MIDYKALCAELITLNYKRTDNPMEWSRRWEAFMDRARAALAEPEPPRRNFVGGYQPRPSIGTHNPPTRNP